jgi:hypothetical protein
MISRLKVWSAKTSSASLLAHRLPDERLVGGDDLVHLRVDGLDVLRGEGPADVEVVVEAVGDRRTDGEGRTLVQREHRLGQHVGGRVAQDAAALVGVLGDDLERAAARQRTGEVEQLAVELHRHRRLGETFADRAGHVVSGGTVRMLDDGAVGESNLYWHLDHSLDCWERRRVLPVPGGSFAVFGRRRIDRRHRDNGEVGA